MNTPPTHITGKNSSFHPLCIHIFPMAFFMLPCNHILPMMMHTTPILLLNYLFTRAPNLAPCSIPACIFPFLLRVKFWAFFHFRLYCGITFTAENPNGKGSTATTTATAIAHDEKRPEKQKTGNTLQYKNSYSRLVLHIIALYPPPLTHIP